MSEHPPAYYGEYLQLNQLLSAQQTRSAQYADKPAHDEMLFIIIHQVYELWFKQILHELDAILALFQADYVDEKDIGRATAHQSRIIEIQKILIDQVNVLETMQPMDFLEFRKLLVPASGFQSVQFRQIENKLGLPQDKRLKYNNVSYKQVLNAEDQSRIDQANSGPSLFEGMQQWLERIPFLNIEGFDFWDTYRQTIEKLFEQDRHMILEDTADRPEEQSKQLAKLKATEEDFQTLFSEDAYQALLDNGQKRLSYQATKAALLIMLYQSQPILNRPYRFLMNLLTIDEQFTTWRYRHALMVQRMIGAKIGTGGSMGSQYLMKTLDKHQIYKDLAHLSTFLVPRSQLPPLPPNLERRLGFYDD